MGGDKMSIQKYNYTNNHLERGFFVKKALLRKSDRQEPRATLWPGTGPLLGTAPPTVGRVGWFG